MPARCILEKRSVTRLRDFISGRLRGCACTRAVPSRRSRRRS